MPMAGIATRTATLTTWRDVDLARVRLAEGKDGFKRSWIMLMPEGEFEHPQYGKLEFSPKKLQEFKSNFDNRVRKIDIALDQDHDGGKATGWLEQLALRDGGLYGLVRWTSLGAQLLADQIYRYFSPEFGTFTDPESGKKFSNVIIGGALTNRPFLKNMPAVKLAEVSHKSWASVNKSKLPASCFLIVGDRSKKDTWRLPVYEGAGEIGADGMYTKRGPLNLNAVRAALADLGGAHTGTPMSGVPGGLQTKLEGWLKRYGGDSAAASERNAAVATRNKSRKLADPEPDEDSDDEQEQNAQEFDLDSDVDDEQMTHSADEEETDEELDETDENAEDEDETQEFADKKPAFKGAAKPFGKGGKKAANNAAADDSDEDEELDDMTSDDEEYDDGTADDGEPDGDEDEMMPAPKGKKGKGMPVKKMTEPQLQAEVVRLREESRLKDAQIKTLREEQFKLGVSKKLVEFTRNIRTESEDAEFALPRSFKLAYQEFMFSDGIRLSESSLTKLNDLVEKALRLGTVPLTSLANQIEDGRVQDADDRRPRESRGSVDRTPDAEKIALAEHHMTLSDLVKKDPEKAEAIYMRLEAQTRRGKPAA